jgi:hypothetical protein
VGDGDFVRWVMGSVPELSITGCAAGFGCAFNGSASEWFSW